MNAQTAKSAASWIKKKSGQKVAIFQKQLQISDTGNNGCL